MKIKDCIENLYFHTGKLSDVLRQLCFAGIALIWIFRPLAGDANLIDINLKWAGVFIFTSLAIDLMQYLYSSIAWRIYLKAIEDRYEKDDEFKAPSAINCLSEILFYSKSVFAIIAYIIIIRFLLYRIFSS